MPGVAATKCPICNKGTLRSRRGNYPFVESGLPVDVALVDIEIRRCSSHQCGEVFPMIPSILPLYRATISALRKQRLRAPLRMRYDGDRWKAVLD